MSTVAFSAFCLLNVARAAKPKQDANAAGREKTDHDGKQQNAIFLRFFFFPAHRSEFVSKPRKRPQPNIHPFPRRRRPPQKQKQILDKGSASGKKPTTLPPPPPKKTKNRANDVPFPTRLVIQPALSDRQWWSGIVCQPSQRRQPRLSR